MAVTFTKACASAHELRYLMTSAGAETATLAAATILADTEPGPLRDYLRTYVADQAAAQVLLFGNSRCVVDITPRDANAAWIVDANAAANLTTIVMTSAAEDSSTGSVLSIEYRHSLVQ